MCAGKEREENKERKAKEREGKGRKRKKRKERKGKKMKGKKGKRRKGNKKFTLVGGGAVRFGWFNWLAAEKERKR